MKMLFALFSLLFSLSAMAEPDLEQTLSLTVKNFSADDFLKEVSKQTKVRFVFDKKIHFSNKMSMFVKEESLKNILNDFASRQDVEWVALKEDAIRISATARRAKTAAR